MAGITRATVPPLGFRQDAVQVRPVREMDERQQITMDALALEGHKLTVDDAAQWFENPLDSTQRVRGPARVRNVVVVGGGTAGLLTALALHGHRGCRVTLVRSPNYAPLPVGEATTPIVPRFLHETLGISVEVLFREVQPTLKLGIRFRWDPEFIYPFGAAEALTESWHYEGSSDATNLNAVLMQAGKTPLLQVAGQVRQLRIPVAYHLDNVKFTRFLEGELCTRSIPIRDLTVTAATRNQDGSLSHLLADDGASIPADFFVDCTGFRADIGGNMLDIPVVDYSSTLACDRAVFGCEPTEQPPGVETTATAMTAGWRWSIPHHHGENHVGYVYSAAHQSDDKASAELLQDVPGLKEPRTLRFTTGRRRQFISGNVALVGNAYGFVEPLESTALHMTIVQIQRLRNLLPTLDPVEANAANTQTAERWDYLRDFIGIHYALRRSGQSSFWEWARDDLELGPIRSVLERARTQAPLSARRNTPQDLDEIFGAKGFDFVTLGQRFVTPQAEPADTELGWRTRQTLARRVVDACLTSKETKRLLEAHGDALRAGETVPLRDA